MHRVPVNIFIILISSFFLFSVEGHAKGISERQAPSWSYAGDTHPDHWGTLEEDFHACALGGEQSPIDIPTASAVKTDIGAINFAYRPTWLKIIDNGHTIQVSVADGNTITVGGESYELKQFHFHHPSEELIDGKAYPLVAHLVHKSEDNKIAVIAVLFEQGNENDLIKELWEELPEVEDEEIHVPDETFNLASLLPTSRAYYNFTGSLTTPPCSEGVNWFVLQTPVEVSTEQISHFGRIYPMNARPVQALNGRTIQFGGE